MQEISKIIRANTEAPFGFCPFSAVREHLLECRAKQRLPQNAKTIICFAFPYKVGENAPKNISRYASIPDYHNVLGRELQKITAELSKAYAENEFEYFVDNSPIPEVFAASAAGLGVMGQNGLLITERFGSFVFLGEIVTDLEIPAEVFAKNCSSCGKCRSACPVGLKKENCLSALTQQKRELSPKQQELIIKGGSVWGCDICQNACPLNKTAETTFVEEFKEGYRDSYEKGENIQGRAYEWRGEGVIARNALLFDNIPQVIAGDASALKGE